MSTRERNQRGRAGRRLQRDRDRRSAGGGLGRPDRDRGLAELESRGQVSFDRSGLDEGATFRWKSGPGTITSTIEAVEGPRRIAWSGTSFGIKAIHVHTLEPRNGGTLVRTEESYDGLVARLFHGRLQKTLDKTLRGGLAY